MTLGEVAARAGASFLEDSESDDQALLEREARCTRERFRNMGYKEGVFQSRQTHVQRGFDAGYEIGALKTFCETLNGVHDGQLDLGGIGVDEHSPSYLERLKALQGQIGIAIHDTMQERMSADH